MYFVFARGVWLLRPMHVSEQVAWSVANKRFESALYLTKRDALYVLCFMLRSCLYKLLLLFVFLILLQLSLIFLSFSRFVDKNSALKLRASTHVMFGKKQRIIH